MLVVSLCFVRVDFAGQMKSPDKGTVALFAIGIAVASAIGYVLFLSSDDEALSGDLYGEVLRGEPGQIGCHHYIVSGFVNIDRRTADEQL
jgi:hypothetical protein